MSELSGIIYCQAAFREFKKGTSESISKIPARDDDVFLLVTARGSGPEIGFDISAVTERTIREFASACYSSGQSGVVFRSGECRGKSIPMFLFKDNKGGFSRLVDEHDEYVLKMKKFKVVSKYREMEMPKPSRLSAFLDGPQRRIDDDLYVDLIEGCDYVCIRNIAGEFGWAAFTAFAKDSEILIAKLQELSGGKRPVRLRSMDEMPRW
ncbi:hypothetical protein [Pseudomonas sp. NPDC089401]|uniref:hypothetical protein n=1 Tax=Pseudomonas sp. NPDC089401 TaxID=3364462 RepID=UPI003800153F